MKEKDIQTLIRIEASRCGLTVFRNNVGQGYTVDGAPIKFGLCPGSSDLVGWETVTITSAMVGRSIAVFTALEVKTATGRIRSDQQRFIDIVRQSGGYAAVVRSPEDINAGVHRSNSGRGNKSS